MDLTTESPWRALAALARPYRGRLVALGVVLTTSAALPLAGPLLVREFVDDAIAGASDTRLATLAGAYIAIGLAAQAVSVAVTWSATDISWRVTNDVRIELTDRVLTLGLGYHHRHPPGELVERIDGDLSAVAQFVARFVVMMLSGVLTLVGVVVVLTVVDVRLGAAVAIALVPLTVRAVQLRNRAVAASAADRSATAVLMGGIEERLAGLDDLRANGAGEHAMYRFFGDSRNWLQAGLHRERATLGLHRQIFLGLAVVNFAVVVLAAAGNRAGWASIGTVFLAFQYMLLLRRPIDQIAEQLQEVQRAAGAMSRVQDLRRFQPEVGWPGEETPPPGPLSVAFDGVRVAYGDVTVLHDVDLVVPAGRSLGVVGRTGGGKTTLARTVARLVDPVAGQVRLGGVALPDLDRRAVRRAVAVVPQEVRLVGGTLRDEVTLFDPAPSDADVVTALERVGLADRLLADGVEAVHRPIGAAGGSGLSAGEEQLLAFARVFLRDPGLVILDEATARVDPSTEDRISAAMTELIGSRTAIVIAHRLSTLDRVDEIAVVADGRIVEHGPRTELLADGGGRFAAMLATDGVRT